MSYIVLIIVLSAVVYRVTRFIVLDTLLETPRDKLMGYLDLRQDKWWASKLDELLGCPFCVSIWVAAGAIGLQYLFVGGVPIPVWSWLAIASGALVLYAIIDSE